jgi:hypothetical protein
MLKKYFIIHICIFNSCFVFAQNDTIPIRGTIRIAKPKAAEIYIKALANFNDYDFSKLRTDVAKKDIYEPLPVLEGYTYPFNYTKYFIEKFKTKEIDLKGKTSDTVKIEVKILPNGKVYIKDKTPLVLVGGVPAIYNEKAGGYKLNNLYLNCLYFLNEIKVWEPAYVLVPEKSTFKKHTVIKRSKTNVKASGIITIVFSSASFEK